MTPRMSPAEHYREAENALNQAQQAEDDTQSLWWLHTAQVHATLAAGPIQFYRTGDTHMTEPTGECQAIVQPARTHPYPEPPEHCEADTAPDSNYCPAHLHGEDNE